MVLAIIFAMILFTDYDNSAQPYNEILKPTDDLT
jgi:hypothetical protein